MNLIDSFFTFFLPPEILKEGLIIVINPLKIQVIKITKLKQQLKGKMNVQ